LLDVESQPVIKKITIDNLSGNIKEMVYEWITIKWRSKKVKIPSNFENLKEIKQLRALEKAKPELRGAVEDKIKYIIKGYANYPKIVNTGIGVKHKVTLTMENGRLVILKDVYNEGPDLLTSPDFLKTKNSLPQDNSVSEDNTRSTSSISYYYDRQSAANYADQYVYHHCGCNYGEYSYYPNSYNPCYVNMAPGDCANYVSQCLFAGGQPRVFDDGTYPTGINPWYYKNNGNCDTYGDKWNSAWDWAPTLYSTIKNSGRGMDESYSIACIGDVAFYRKASSGTVDHAVFIVVSGNSGNPDLYDSHTSDRYHCPTLNNSHWFYVWIYGGPQSINY